MLTVVQISSGLRVMNLVEGLYFGDRSIEFSRRG